MNKMREIRIEKVTINIGCGESGVKVDRAKKLLEKLTGKKVIVTQTHDRTTFGMSKKRAIGSKITLRGKDAEEFLRKALDAIGHKLSGGVFDSQGNFSFGIKEHIDLPGVRYDPDIGIYGMDVCITLERRGFRVKRKRNPRKVGKNHLIRPDEAREWLTKNFEVNIE